jgi:Flp pilus assembly secretin CpaC
MLAKTVMLMMLAPSAALLMYGQSKSNDDEAQLKELFSGTHTDASLTLKVGKTEMLNPGSSVQRVAVNNAALMEVTAVTPTQFRLEPKAKGSAVLVVWLQNGKRTVYKVTIEERGPEN